MSFLADLALAAQAAEREERIEQQHEEILILGDVIEAQQADLKDAERELDRLSEKIEKAVADLRFLTEVPLRDLEDSIDSIMGELKA